MLGWEKPLREHRSVIAMMPKLSGGVEDGSLSVEQVRGRAVAGALWLEFSLEVPRQAL